MIPSDPREVVEAPRGRCILCGREHEVDRTVQVSEETGEPVPPADGPFWKHASDGIEATVCDWCVGEPDRIVAAHRLLTSVGSVIPRD